MISCEAKIVDGRLNGKSVSPTAEFVICWDCGKEDSEAAKMVKRIDANGDGKVSEDENFGAIKRILQPDRRRWEWRQ